ncbi:uncharacterized protein IUM83_05997 [Phytophthora cinnamomi]|uniref:uncharacterized protein n=1 Tax=Phytophthora cinnamomi TaxID=4785 RepID=UPI00355AA151|nr:hypothetical protein IUM83_05997 [Phytophthora cinnamomi]
MASRKITRCRGARGQLVLYNPQTVPGEVAQELEGIYGFRPKGRLLKVEKAFGNVFAISILPIPRYSELQLLAINNTVQLKIFTVFSVSAAVKLIVSVHEKHACNITEKADQLNKRMNDELLTRKHAMETLQVNFPFLSVDECDMLLDLFGNIASIAQAGAAKLLDVTVLSTAAAHAIEEFFKTEYAVE